MSGARGVSTPRAFVLLVACAIALSWSDAATAQRRKPAPRKPAPTPAAKKGPADVKCAELLGTGVRTGATYCFVLAGNDPAEGVIVTVPPHTGEAVLTFDLHNRHTYSEEEMRAGRKYAKYTAVVGVLTMKGELLEQGAIQTEFRAVGDLYERIGGGAGPGGVKAVAPLGRELVTVRLPQGVDQVSLLGQILEVISPAGRETTAPGRPVALISNVNVEYRPGRARR